MKLGNKVRQDWWEPFLPKWRVFYDRDADKFMLDNGVTVAEFIPTRSNTEQAWWVLVEESGEKKC